jgi:hypothetical protein
MKVIDVADEIYRELGSPTDTSLPSISFWIRSNIGALNNHINMEFIIDGATLEVSYLDDNDEKVNLNIEEAAILKKMYLIYDYDNKLRTVTGAASWDSVLEIDDGGTRVKKVNKSEIGKTLAQAKKEEVLQLNNLINSYKLRESKPRQVAGDDTIEGNFPEKPINRKQYPN